jgi:hypothetical protein
MARLRRDAMTRGADADARIGDLRSAALRDPASVGRTESAGRVELRATRPVARREHRITPKGFESERDLNLCASDLRICVAIRSWR